MKESEGEESTEEESHDKIIGKLTISDRSKKILNYKHNLLKRRKNVPISKKYDGRKRVACQKLRVNGRFVKKSE